MAQAELGGDGVVVGVGASEDAALEGKGVVVAWRFQQALRS